MSTVTLASLIDAVESTLSSAVAVSQSYDELTEGINDAGVLQVYPEECRVDAGTSNDRTTFRAGVRQTQVILNADYYARQRSNIGDDMNALVTGIDAITAVLEAQKTKPYFGAVDDAGEPAIKTWSWSWQRVIFTYANVQYMGARFTLTLRVF